MDLNWQIKRFKALSAADLYQVLQLRSEVFVVEQNCVYQDIDGKDLKALHLIGNINGKVAAYARLFNAGDYFEECSIGRVVVAYEFRKMKLGHDLMRQAILAIEQNFGSTQITISAQLYLKNFYEGHGFKVIGEPYPEDDIPHIRMEKS
jgi:ElaA protein